MHDNVPTCGALSKRDGKPSKTLNGVGVLTAPIRLPHAMHGDGETGARAHKPQSNENKPNNDSHKKPKAIRLELRAKTRARPIRRKPSPGPLLGLLDQARAEGVAFDVSHHRRQMFVAGDWKRLESSLIDVAHACGAVMGAPALRMGDGEPAEELRDLLMFAAFRPDNEAPMVAHRHIG